VLDLGTRRGVADWCAHEPHERQHSLALDVRQPRRVYEPAATRSARLLAPCSGLFVLARSGGAAASIQSPCARPTSSFALVTLLCAASGAAPDVCASRARIRRADLAYSSVYIAEESLTTAGLRALRAHLANYDLRRRCLTGHARRRSQTTALLGPIGIAPFRTRLRCGLVATSLLSIARHERWVDGPGSWRARAATAARCSIELLNCRPASPPRILRRVRSLPPEFSVLRASPSLSRDLFFRIHEERHRRLSGERYGAVHRVKRRARYVTRPA